MKIKLGKLYKTRAGLKAFITLRKGSSCEYPYWANIEIGKAYRCTANGYVDCYGVSHPEDLVEEWSDPLTIEIGKDYRNRINSKVRIICIDSKASIFPIIGLVQNIDGTESITTYKRNGTFFSHSMDADNDLLCEWIDEPPRVEFDQSLLPAWANKAIAMDKDGQWYSYPGIPEADTYHWIINNRIVEIPNNLNPKWDGYWKDSLLVFES